MRIGNFHVWVTDQEALDNDCTHYAWLLGIVPGFINEDSKHGGPLWISRSDLTNWLEDVLQYMYSTMCSIRGIEPHFSFTIGDEISVRSSTGESK